MRRRAGRIAPPPLLPTLRSWLAAALSGAALLTAVPVATSAQAGAGGGKAPDGQAEPPRLPLDQAALAEAFPDGPFARMSMLLEKSIFNVNVLRLSLRFDPETAGALETAATVEGKKARRDSLARVAFGARRAFVEVRYLRSFGFDDFLGGTRSNLKRAPEAGLFSAEALDRISDRLLEWYAWLEGRGPAEGDRMLVRLRADTVRTVYLAASGDTLADRTRADGDLRDSVLGRYFAPGSDFRKGLVGSLPATR